MEINKKYAIPIFSLPFFAAVFVFVKRNSPPQYTMTHAPIECHTWHQRSPVHHDLSKPITLYLPLTSAAPVKFKVVVVQTKQTDISTTVLMELENQYKVSDKNQTVVYHDFQTGVLDFSPQLKIQGERGKKADQIILAVKIPLSASDVSIQPVLHPIYPTIGAIKEYPSTTGVYSLNSPFQFLEKNLTPGSKVPEHLSKILSKIKPGELVLPTQLAQKAKILPVKPADMSRCSHQQ